MGADPLGKNKRNRAAGRPRVRPMAGWEWLNAERMHALVLHMQALGGAVMFSRTTDGGSLSLRLYLGDEVAKKYPKSPTDLYYDLLDAFEELQAELPPWLMDLDPDAF